MGDPERLTCEIANPDAEHHAAFLLAIALQRERIVAVRHDHRRDRVRPLAWLGDVEAEYLAFRPDRDRAANRFGQQAMAQEHVLELFVEQHVNRLTQREQQVNRRGAGIFPVMLGAFAFGPVPIGRPQSGRLMHLAGAVVGGDEAEAGRRHQALLRAGHGDVDAPRIHLERHAAEGGDRIDHEQRRVTGGLDRLADGFDVVDGARGGIDLHRQDRLDFVILVLPQACFDLSRPYRAAPVALQHFDVGAHGGGGVAPADGKPAAFQHQNLVAARQHVAERSFPCAVAIGDVDVGAALGGKQPGEIAQQAVGHIDHGVGIDVQRGTMHRPQHFVGHGGGPGDSQKFAARANDHCYSSLLLRQAMLARPGAESKRIRCMRGIKGLLRKASIVWSRGSQRLRRPRPNRTSACPC